MRRGEMQAVSVKGSGTWALRLGEVAGDNLPDAGRQAGGLGILGRVLHVQALLLARPQDAALQCLQGKKEGLRGTWDLGLPGVGGRETKSCRTKQRCGCPGDPRETPKWKEAWELESQKAQWEDTLCAPCPGKEAPSGAREANQSPRPTHRPPRAAQSVGGSNPAPTLDG